MGADSEPFWTVVWIVTVLAGLVTLGLLVVHWRRGRGPRRVPGLPYFLDKDKVMNLYLLGGYGDALVREVEERVTVTQDGKMQMGARVVELTGGGSREHQIVYTYVKNAEPVEVLGVVIRALDSAHGIVYVDLSGNRIEANAAWRRTRSSRLSGLQGERANRGDVYVWVSGLFRLAEDHEDKTVFLAAIGDSEAQVRMECSDTGIYLDGDTGDNRFNGRCLGKVQSWQAHSGKLEILPVAILR